jgi:hypothetical protein
MAPPKTWDDFLSSPVLVITTSDTSSTYVRTEKRLRDAKFTTIVPILMPSVNTNLSTVWSQLFKNSPPFFNTKDTSFMDTVNYPKKQEYTAAHFIAYQYMLDKNYEYAFIVEDDIVFHKDWELLAPKYFEVTPPDYELCYVGHHCGCGIDAHVIRVPTFSLQSILITREGAQYLINKALYHPLGVCTLDCMINEMMMAALVNQEEGTDGISDDFCNWYAWNAEMFPDTTANKIVEHAQKDQGLIFKENQTLIVI